MTNEKKRTFEEREAATKRAVTVIVRELKGGATRAQIEASGRFTKTQIYRGYKAFEKSSFKGCKSDPTHKCKCGASVKKLNILGECFACEVRRAAGVAS